MGLITGLLTLPLAPVRGVGWLGKQIQEQAEREYYDPAAIRGALNDVEMQRELGKISEAEAEQMEEDLLARLLESRQEYGTGIGEEWHG